MNSVFKNMVGIQKSSLQSEININKEIFQKLFNNQIIEEQIEINDESKSQKVDKLNYIAEDLSNKVINIQQKLDQ